MPSELALTDHERIYGPRGVGCYTTEPVNGEYYSFFFRRAGTGARGDTYYPEYYVYVERKTSTRKSKKAAKLRAKNMAHGRPLSEGKTPRRKAPMGMARCPKEKKFVVPTNVSQKPYDLKGQTRYIILGECPDCGTGVQKFGRLIDCPECGQIREGRPDDYICLWCREEVP